MVLVQQIGSGRVNLVGVKKSTEHELVISKMIRRQALTGILRSCTFIIMMEVQKSAIRWKEIQYLQK